MEQETCVMAGRKGRKPEPEPRGDKWPAANLILSRELIAGVDMVLAGIYGAGGARLSRSEAGRALFAALVKRWKGGKLDGASIRSEEDLADIFAGGK